MEDKKLKEQEEIIEQVVEEEVVAEEVIAEEQVVEEIVNNKEILSIYFDRLDLQLLLTALNEYSRNLKEQKRRLNTIVIDKGFNTKVDVEIKRTDELRFLIKKEALILNKDLELYEDEGEVIGIETWETTEDGKVTSVSKPDTIGQTPEVPKVKKEKAKTSVQTVSEEL